MINILLLKFWASQKNVHWKANKHRQESQFFNSFYTLSIDCRYFEIHTVIHSDIDIRFEIPPRFFRTIHTHLLHNLFTQIESSIH